MAGYENTVVVLLEGPAWGARLEPAFAPREVADLYGSLARDVVRSLSEVPDVRVCVAGESEPASPGFRAVGSDLPMFVQREDGFEARALDAIAGIPTDRTRHVVVVAGDLPGLPPSTLERAFADLEDVDLVLGPSTGGGLYLIGMSRLCEGLFDDMSCASERGLERGLENARRHGYTHRLLPARTRVTSLADVERLWSRSTHESMQRWAPLTRLTLFHLMRHGDLNQRRRLSSSSRHSGLGSLHRLERGASEPDSKATTDGLRLVAGGQRSPS